MVSSALGLCSLSSHCVCPPRNLAIGIENRCFIELATKALSEEQIRMAEGICNDLIRQSVPMSPRWCPPDSPEMEQVSGRGRTLPNSPRLSR